MPPPDVNFFADRIAATRSPAMRDMFAARAEIMRLCDASAAAVLTPMEPGRIGRAERFALASRISRWNGDAALADRYGRQLDEMSACPVLRALGLGEMPELDARQAAIVTYVDIVTKDPVKAGRAEIAAMQSAGLTDADVVRLAELVAFVNFQARVMAGLTLIEEHAA
ncbi:hypothetical protein AAC691_06845 [Nguyenibacter vanlangensis]|uniref:CMD domain protein n=1 Tax=Nguyenibacter vanlangensis TaxID=1216886 RepID=A0ABZ3D8P0_9PROT